MTETPLYGTDLFGNPVRPQPRGLVASRFLIPPFSVMNAREEFWQTRKRGWIDLGIKSEIGRDAKAYNTQEWMTEKNLSGAEQSGTSIFDPVLTELVVRWFSPPGGTVLDPFAGGSVRGIVAGALGRRYHGIELRREQVDANREQAELIQTDVKPEWIHGDAMECIDSAPDADLLFTCPPYGDLEVYSDDPRDISTMEYHTFIPALKRIILRGVRKLRDDRFAVIVVGDFRDAKGFYRNFVSDTISAFTEAGMKLYNEGILVTAVGTLSIRVTKQFDNSRKFGKTHQNVLVFVKGDPKRATRAIGPMEGTV